MAEHPPTEPARVDEFGTVRVEWFTEKTADGNSGYAARFPLIPNESSGRGVLVRVWTVDSKEWNWKVRLTDREGPIRTEYDKEGTAKTDGRAMSAALKYCVKWHLLPKPPAEDPTTEVVLGYRLSRQERRILVDILEAEGGRLKIADNGDCVQNGYHYYTASIHALERKSLIGRNEESAAFELTSVGGRAVAREIARRLGKKNIAWGQRAIATTKPAEQPDLEAAKRKIEVLETEWQTARDRVLKATRQVTIQAAMVAELTSSLARHAASVSHPRTQSVTRLYDPIEPQTRGLGGLIAALRDAERDEAERWEALSAARADAAAQSGEAQA